MNSKTYVICDEFNGMTADEIRSYCDDAVSHPGRLEGNSAVVAYFDAISTCTCDSTFDVSAEDVEIFPELAGIAAVAVYPDNFGFVNMTRHESIEDADRHVDNVYDEFGYNGEVK
jgi:hypothetical protein